MRLSVFTLSFSLVAAFHMVIPTQAEAASALFRAKRTWWAPPPTGTTPPSSLYVSYDYHPRATGPNKAPPAQAYIGNTSTRAHFISIPSRVIRDYTRSFACPTFMACRPGWPVSVSYHSYWNVKGNFRSRNPYAPSVTTTHYAGCCYPSTTTTFNGAYWNDRDGAIKITPGANRFGGTLKFLYGPNHRYFMSLTPYSEFPTFRSRQYGKRGGKAPTPYSRIHEIYFLDHTPGFLMYRYPLTINGYKYPTGTYPGYYARKVQYVSTIAPWTTGMVMVQSYGAVSYWPTRAVTATGYDNRTPNGYYGVISLVHPRLVHTYVIPDPEVGGPWRERSFAQIWQMELHFLPEPGGAVLLVAGLGALAGLYGLRRR